MVRTLPVDETDPATFLHLLEGPPRGFWGRGGEWVVWGGALMDVHLPDGTEGGRDPSSASDPSAEMEGGTGASFRKVAERLFGSEARGGGGGSPSPMAFGGFPFLPSEEGEGGEWAGFLEGRFLVPRILLLNDGEGARLLAQGRVGEEGELDRELLALEARLAPVRERPAGIPADPLALPLGGEGAREEWEGGVRAVLAALARGDVAKVVLARTRDVTLPGPVELSRVLRFLRHENRMAHVYLMDMEPGRVLLGAAPEILGSLREGRFSATAVAGSAPRGGDDAQDQALARRLLASGKDREEHRLTAEEMVEVLEGRLLAMEVEEEPHVLTLARIQHLETRIKGVAPPHTHILSLVEALHPTPAVCGRPRDRALTLIREAEPFRRGWYAGPVGWFNGAGEGEFVPALRSAVGGGREWRLFAGAGIVTGSDPAAEWDETALKFEPALRALAAGMEP